MATKVSPPRGPTDDELLAVGKTGADAAPVDTLPLTDDERRALAEAKAHPQWIDGATVSAMIAARRREA